MKRISGVFLLILIIISCKKEKTVWETDWSAPIINDTLSLKNLVNDSTLAEQVGFYVLDLERTLFDLKVSELIEIPDTTIEEVFTFSGTLNLTPGFSFVNSAEEHALNVPEAQLKKIKLKKGYIDVRLENPLLTKTIFNVELPGVTLNGNTFSGAYEAPMSSGGQSGVSIQTIDLSGYEIDLTGLSGGSYNLLRSQITVETDPLGPSVTMTPSDITKVFATFRGVEISYARGYFGNRFITDTTNVLIEFLNSVQSGMVDFPASIISFEIENGIKVSAEGTLTTISNINNTGNTVDLTSAQIGTSFNIDPATGAWNSLVPSTKVIEFNSTNSNLEAYLENLGSSHTLGYSMQLNPWGNVSGGWDELYESSRLKIKMKAYMPLTLGFDNLVLRDTFDLTLNQNPDKTRIKSGELILQAGNAFPISGAVKLILLDENKVPLGNVVGTNTLNSSLYGTLDVASNLLVSNSEIHFIITEDLLTEINDVKHIIVESTFNSVNPISGLNEQMSIPVGAFLAVKLKTKFVTENKF